MTNNNTKYSLLLRFANVLFHITHLTTISFFLSGWMFEETRIAHYVLSILILLSWHILHCCLITEIQWRIKGLLGDRPEHDQYVKYLLDKVTGRDLNPNATDKLTKYTYYIILVIATIQLIYKNY